VYQNFEIVRHTSSAGVTVTSLLRFALDDGRIVPVGFDLRSNNHIYLSFPYFARKLQYDPSLGLLLGGSAISCDNSYFWVTIGFLAGAYCCSVLICIIYYAIGRRRNRRVISTIKRASKIYKLQSETLLPRGDTAKLP